MYCKETVWCLFKTVFSFICETIIISTARVFSSIKSNLSAKCCVCRCRLAFLSLRKNEAHSHSSLFWKHSKYLQLFSLQKIGMLKEFVDHLQPCVFYLWVYLNAKLLHASLTSLWLLSLAKSPFYGINLHVKLVFRNSLLKNIGNIFVLYSKVFVSECFCCPLIICRADFITELDCFNSLPRNIVSHLPALQFGSQQENILVCRQFSEDFECTFFMQMKVLEHHLCLQ